MNKIIKISIFLLLANTASFSQNALGLKDCMNLGFKNSKDLIISNSKIISSEARITEATSQLLPQLKFSAGYMRLSDIPPFEVSVPFYPLPIKLADVILNNYNLKLSLQQPLFTGFRLISLRNAAQYNKSASETDLIKDKNDLALNIEVTYWNFYKAKLMKKLMDDNLQQAEQHVVDTRNLLDNGLTTKNDLLKLQVQYANAKLQQIDAQNNVDLTRSALNKAIGLPLTNPTEIEMSAITPTGEALNLNELITEARNNRSELKSLGLRINAGQENIKAARSGWFPAISLIGDYYYSRPNSRIQPPLDQFKGTWDIGINFIWDIWNWGNTSAQTEEAEQTVLQSRTSLEQLKDAIELEVNQNYLALNYAKEKLDVNKIAIEQATENYRTIQDKYNVQLATSTDLIDAETSLLQAETNYNNSLVDYQLSKIKLEKSLGRPLYNKK